MWLLLLRQDARLTRLSARWLARQNRTTRKPIVASGGPIISLTTYGTRIRTVHLTLESIAKGSILPSRIILWLDDRDAFRNRPRSLHRLEERGLEIKLAQNYGPHTKYYPFLESTDKFGTPLVTADDDHLYPRSWLSGLIKSFQEYSTVISCYRAYEMKIADRAIAPYRTWGPCQSVKPSFLNFAAGNSGCIYPPGFLQALKTAGKGFEQPCPKADDVWLHANAIRARFMVRQIRRHHLNFPFLPETQDGGLFRSNIDLGQNDVQIKNTYTSADIGLLVSCLSSHSAQTKLNRSFPVALSVEGDDGRVEIDRSESSIT
jgi:hypothetical protein